MSVNVFISCCCFVRLKVMFDNMLSIRVCEVFWIPVGCVILGKKHFVITVSKKWLT